MRRMIEAMICAWLAWMAVGCAALQPKTQDNLSQTDTQARENEKMVDLAAIQAGQIQKLLSSATQNIDKGFRFQDSGKEVARDTQGNAIFVEVPTANGTIVKAPVYVDWSTELSLNSYVDLARDVEGLELSVGQLTSLQEKSNQLYKTTPNRNGLSLKITKTGGTSTNSGAIDSIKRGNAEDRKATGEAVIGAIKVDWDGRIEFLANGVVKVIEATGNSIVGKLIEMTPVGAANNLVKAVIETDAGTVTKIVPKPQ